MANSSNNLASELDAMLKELTEQDLAELPPEKILDLKKKLNPYGRTIEGSNKYLNFSITQIQLEYWKKLIITAFVGYLNRRNDEWKVPENVPVVSVYEYLENPSKVDTPENVLKKGDPSTLYDYEFNRKWMQKRIIVKEFLEEMFQFNPDEHVRSAYIPNRADKNRKPINTPAGKLAVDHLKKTDKDFAAKEKLYNDIQQLSAETKNDDGNISDKQPVKMKKVKKIVKDKHGKTKTIIKEVPDLDDSSTTKNGVEKSTSSTKDNTFVVKDNGNTKDNSTTSAKDGTLSTTVRSMIPPHDVFGVFKMYLQDNYEELRDAVKDLYCEKPEYELAINPYSWHDSREEAEAFKKKHANEVIAEVFTVDSGKWNFFDCFKEQRENVNFYTEDTIIIEEMMKQLERDEKLGRDLMKKRVEKAKKKNIIEAGPDAEGFKKWRDQNSDIKNLGAAHFGDVVSDECPSDAIQVDVWKVAKGGLDITKDKFFSLAEAPTFVKEAQDKAIAEGKMSVAEPLSQSTSLGVQPPRANNL